jgi:hypothetical protein
MSCDDKTLKAIRNAEDEIREICETEENKRRASMWAVSNVSSDYFHAIPADDKKIPLVIELEREGYAEALSFDLVRFYKDPYLHYLTGLRTQIYKFRTFDDDTPVSKKQPVYESSAFEKCIFKKGEVIYTEHDALASKEPVLHERADLDTLEYPDFKTGGCMPDTIAFFEKIRETASDDFDVSFPQWGRSPWGTAWHLRGMDNLMFDYLEDPEWLKKFLDFLAESRKRWTKQRNEYLGVALSHANIYNDEVTHPIVSPKMYEECILPSETGLSEFFGGLSYWHSCGNTTYLYNLIQRIPKLEMVTVSAWSDVKRAGMEYRPDMVLEVQLHNYRDVLHPESENTLSERIELIKESTSGHKAIVHACGLVFPDGYGEAMRRIKILSETARKTLQ